MTRKKQIPAKQPSVAQAELINAGSGDLMDRVVSILEQARTNTVRAVNSNMVIAYWLIGREIVEELQRGEGRTEYGQNLLHELSKQLTRHYGHGLSVTNLRRARLFYQAFKDRAPIHPTLSDEFNSSAGTEALSELQLALETKDDPIGFSPNLSWSHYLALTRVEDPTERRFGSRPSHPQSCQSANHEITVQDKPQPLLTFPKN